MLVPWMGMVGRLDEGCEGLLRTLVSLGVWVGLCLCWKEAMVIETVYFW